MAVFVAYCDKYYNELKGMNKILNVNINDLQQDITERSKLSDKEIFNKPAMYEVLMFDKSIPTSSDKLTIKTRYVNRLYLDLEKLPYSNFHFVKNIVDDFIKYIKTNLKLYTFQSSSDELTITIDKTQQPNEDVDYEWIYTQNQSSSSHYGDSYHIIFKNICTYHTEQTKAFMNDFINKHEQYRKYVDLSVYSVYRLFRLPYSKCASSYCSKQINEDDIHKTDIDNDYIIQYHQPSAKHIIVLDRNDPINFTQRVKQIRTSGTLSKHIMDMIQMLTCDTNDEKAAMRADIYKMIDMLTDKVNQLSK